MFWRCEFLFQQNLRGEDNTYAGKAQTLGFQGRYSITKGMTAMPVEEREMVAESGSQVGKSADRLPDTSYFVFH
ncbi:MAG: hypothetical protein AAFY48_23525, partial [Bacteroidota bacterium]